MENQENRDIFGTGLKTQFLYFKSLKVTFWQILVSHYTKFLILRRFDPLFLKLRHREVIELINDTCFDEKELGKLISSTLLITFLCRFFRIEVKGRISEC